MILRNLALTIVLSCSTLKMNGQSQVGLDIDSESSGDWCGYSVSMPDYLTVGIGAPHNDGNGTRAGHVRVFKWNGSSWVQKGLDINGEAAEDESGYCISMPDANTIAIGAPKFDTPGLREGHVRVFKWNGSSWVQKGLDIDGTENWPIGEVLSMPDENTIAIASPDGSKPSSGKDVGRVVVYKWSGSAWIQKGVDLIGDTINAPGSWHFIGGTVTMPNSNTLAIKAYSSQAAAMGIVRVYSWDGTSWIKKGQNIIGESIDDYSGHSISMPDENTIAIGAFENAGNGVESGHVRIYKWNGASWVQKGLDIDGESAFSYSGFSVSMPNENTVAIGAVGNYNSNLYSGQVRIYKWNGLAWVQQGIDLDGEFDGSRYGHSVCMPDANHVAIGGPYNYHNGTSSGHVRVFSFSQMSASESNENYRLGPNPASDFVKLTIPNIIVTKDYSLTDHIGRELRKGQVNNNEVIIDLSDLPSGVYYFRFQNGLSEPLYIVKD